MTKQCGQSDDGVTKATPACSVKSIKQAKKCLQSARRLRSKEAHTGEPENVGYEDKPFESMSGICAAQSYVY